ncbi:hypothetical protein [Luteolibacter marinus]|uniref:hypothetical protein n=1 Tax=Luteolibacter marinus TaxID=2776705 RepID=UPI001865DD25|nr:hypothetical protein [Luteolibacter marinus]
MIKSLLLLAALPLISTSMVHAGTLARWTPVADGDPLRGNAYSESGTVPGADELAAGFREGLLSRSAALPGFANSGASWTGASDSSAFNPDQYTAIRLLAAGPLEYRIDALSYEIFSFGTSVEDVEGEAVMSDVKFVLRSSLDGFTTDLASLTANYDGGHVASFDLTGVTELQSVTGDIELRLYIWEDGAADPLLFLDLTGDLMVEGEVLSTEPDVVLARWIPRSNPLGNSTEVEPFTKDAAIGMSPVARRVSQGGGTNGSAAWPGYIESAELLETSYLEIELLPSAGADYSVTRVGLTIQTYGTESASGWGAAIRSSLDGFTADLATTAGTDDIADLVFDLSGHPELGSLTQPLTLRIYIWDVDPLDGGSHDPFMWADIRGDDYSKHRGVYVLGAIDAPPLDPAVMSAVYDEELGFRIIVANLTPGVEYDIYSTTDLSEPFTRLYLNRVATSSTEEFIDALADPGFEPRRFYRLETLE